MNFDLKQVTDFLAQFGLVKGLFVLFFLGSHYAIFKLYNGRLDDRQKEIDRLAEENREYREHFVKLIEKGLRISPSKASKRLKKGD